MLSETDSRCHINGNSFHGNIMIMSEHGNALRRTHESVIGERAILERNSPVTSGLPIIRAILEEVWSSLLLTRISVGFFAEQTVDIPMIWYAMTLLWRHCNM